MEGDVEFRGLVRLAADTVSEGSDAAKIRALAERLEVSASTVKKWYYGQQEPLETSRRYIERDLRRIIRGAEDAG